LSGAASGTKAASKKRASAKKAKLNSKGTMGSDMDAFTELPAAANTTQLEGTPLNDDEMDNVSVKVTVFYAHVAQQ